MYTRHTHVHTHTHHTTHMHAHAHTHTWTYTHHCLHQTTALWSYTSDKAVHIDDMLQLHLLQHAVEGDEGSGTPHPRTAMDQHGHPHLTTPLNMANEHQQRGGILRHTMVCPLQELIVSYSEWQLVRVVNLQKSMQRNLHHYYHLPCPYVYMCSWYVITISTDFHYKCTVHHYNYL